MKYSFLAGAAVSAVMGAATAFATIDFRHTISGQPLDLSAAAEEGLDSPAVKEFLETGVNRYNMDRSCLVKAEEVYLSACSGCHGQVGEGKLGPGLNDAYWTYPKNDTDKGLFETIFGGANGQMGPMYGSLSLDEMLLSMSWVRQLYKGEPPTAVWLDWDKRTQFKPYTGQPAVELAGQGAPGLCKLS